jgi:hypothetical protein
MARRTVKQWKAPTVKYEPMHHIPEVTIPGILLRLTVTRDDYRAERAELNHLGPHSDDQSDEGERQEALENDIAGLNKTIRLMATLLTHYKGSDAI